MTKILVNGESVTITGLTAGDGKISFVMDGTRYAFDTVADASGVSLTSEGGQRLTGFVGRKNAKGNHPVMLTGIEALVAMPERGRRQSQSGMQAKPHSAPMPGMVQKILVSVGDTVEAGQKLLVMEAMKLQLAIEAAYAGEVTALHCRQGGLVSDGDVLVDIAASL